MTGDPTDPAAVVGVLQSILRGGGPEAVAILSLLLNIFLWRAWRSAEQILMDFKSEEIERVRTEVKEAREAKEKALDRLGMMEAFIREKQAPPRRRARDDQEA